MSASVSPSIGSRFLICQQEQSAAGNNMRLPSVSELFRMSDRLSEHNRMFGHHNPPPVNTRKPSEGLIDLTSDSSQEVFRTPNLQQYSSTNPSYPSHSVNPGYIDLEFLGMSRRRSREPTIARPRQHKRRRRNDSDDCLITISSPTYSAPTHSFPPSINLTNRIELDLRNSFNDDEVTEIDSSGSSTNKRNANTGPLHPLHKAEEEEEPNTKDEQDRQLADTIKEQAGVSQGASKLNQLTCIICMDNMTNMTATMCGKFIEISQAPSSLILQVMFSATLVSWRL